MIGEREGKEPRIRGDQVVNRSLAPHRKEVPM
jgi:hypothetical protein